MHFNVLTFTFAIDKNDIWYMYVKSKSFQVKK